MKTTDDDVTTDQLDVLIDFAEEDLKENPGPVHHARLMAFRELKRRRAADPGEGKNGKI